MVPYQKWCGQTQPHNSHIWADIRSDSIGLNLQCAGFSCLEHVREANKQAFEGEMHDPALRITKDGNLCGHPGCYPNNCIWGMKEGNDGNVSDSSMLGNTTTSPSL